MIVLLQPYADDDLGLSDGGEPLSIEHFSAQGAVEALIISVLPRATWVDADRLDANFGELALEALRPLLLKHGKPE